MLLKKIPHFSVAAIRGILAAKNLAKATRPKGQGAIAISFRIGSGG
jgi:hypothetical protein